MLTLTIAFLTAAIVNLLIIRYAYVHLQFTRDGLHGPQKVHNGIVPRIGGVGIFCGLLGAGTALLFKPQIAGPELLLTLAVLGLPVFLLGVFEDITKCIPSWARLLAALISAALGYFVIGAAVHRFDILGLDSWLAYWPLALTLTVFAVAGMTHAINIIDGFNGLSAGGAIKPRCAICCVSL